MITTDALARPGRRDRNMQDKHGRIFQAAAALFEAHGYAGVTTQAISERADTFSADVRPIQYERPCLASLGQFFSNRVHPNVGRLISKLLFIAEPVVEKVGLPFEAKVRGLIAFPIANHGSQPEIGTDRDDEMQMVGHEQRQPEVPATRGLVLPDAVEQGFCNRLAAERVDASLFASDGDEEPRRSLNPARDVVRKFVSLRK